MADTYLTYPYEFQGGKKAVASEVNANFEAVKQFASGVNANLNELSKAIADLQKKPVREMLDIYFSFSSEAPVGAYPLWTGETITNCKSLYPQFWKKINNLAEKKQLPSVTAEEYEEKIETYGQCASFVIDTLNGHVRLPKITCFISSISDLTQLAEEQNPGLPNITGDGYWGFLNGVGSSSNSAVYGDNGAPSHLTSTNGKDHYGTPRFLFNASRHNPIYGASDTVQPPAVRLCLYLQVANNQAEISELDTQVIVKQLEEAITSLRSAYSQYYGSLKSLYDEIKEQIIASSPVVKITDISVRPEDFEKDATYSEYPYVGTISVPEAREDLCPTVIFDVNEAESGNFAPIAKTEEGKVLIYAKESPEAEFTILTIVLQ